MSPKFSYGGLEPPVAISYSLLAAMVRHLPLEESILKMEEVGVTAIHYDIADEAITLSADLTHELRKISNIPFDYHIAEAYPNKTVTNLKLQNGDFICAHIESAVDWLIVSSRTRSVGAQFGMGLKVSTSHSLLAPFIEKYEPDFVLIMAAEAGKTGGSFDFGTLEKIHKLREEFPTLRVHVDGGIDDLAAASLRGLGVELLVSGSYIHSGPKASERLAFLRGVPDNPTLRGLLRSRTPVISLESGWTDILNSLDYGGIGCTAVLDELGLYLGIITDHDIRVFLARGGSPLKAAAAEICNRQSFTAHPDEDFWTFMLRLQNGQKMHTAVPLVTNDRQLVGIIRIQDALFRKSE